MTDRIILNKVKISAAITAVGGYVPDTVLSNLDLEKMVDTSDQWITDRTGIKERRILGKESGTSEMGVKAVSAMLEKKGISPEEIDLIIFATITPDMPFPATACILADKIGAKNAWGYDVSAACSGFLFSLRTAASMIESGIVKKAIVVGGDKMSSIIDYTDRNTCIIFGDGAACVLLEANHEGLGIIDADLHVDGEGRHYLHQKAGGSQMPASIDTVNNKLHYVYQDGKTVFKFAVTNMAESAANLMARNKLTAADVDWLVPHQANKRIIEATRERLGLDPEKVMLNIMRYGNTTNGTLPLCLWEWENKLKKGDDLILAAFGGGFTWGSLYLKWAY